MLPKLRRAAAFIFGRVVVRYLTEVVKGLSVEMGRGCRLVARGVGALHFGLVYDDLHHFWLGLHWHVAVKPQEVALDDERLHVFLQALS